MEIDGEELRHRLTERGLTGEEMEEAHTRLVSLARDLSESAWPTDRQVEIWETQIDALCAPPDLEAALKALEARLTSSDLTWLRDVAEEELPKINHTVGAWVRTRWCASPESRLVKWFDRRNVHEPHDISGIILTSLCRQLNGQPTGIDEQLTVFSQQQEEKRERRSSMTDLQKESSDEREARLSSLGGFVGTVPPKK